MTYFNPRSPDGERRFDWMTDAMDGYFNPRSPDGERPVVLGHGELFVQHFNPRSPDGERLERQSFLLPCGGISIHAPRMGSDRPYLAGVETVAVFQSTLPGWGATINVGKASRILP